MMPFSQRTAWDTEESTFAAAIREARARGRALVDLTVSNPTRCGFDFGVQHLLQTLLDARTMSYEAVALGRMDAREAVCGYYHDQGLECTPQGVLLTASTSEAYAWLFRLLCDSGDEVMVPQPGYPLFDYLADLEDVVLHAYPLFYDFGWWIDFAALEARVGPKTKVLIVVHPANPTGHWTHASERSRLVAMCVRHGLALIADEVFLDYGINERVGSFLGEAPECLTFVLSGLSKVAGLPQMKLGWVGVVGPPALVKEAMRRLEVIADTFLSVGGPVQFALPALLAHRQRIQEQIRSRVRENLTALSVSGLEYLPVEAGWSVVVRTRGELGGAEEILGERGVVVHPGSFYGLGENGKVVLSLIGENGDFVQGLRLLT